MNVVYSDRALTDLLGIAAYYASLDTSERNITTQTRPTAPVTTNDQRHELTEMIHATNGAPIAAPRLDPAEIAAIAVPRSLIGPQRPTLR